MEGEEQGEARLARVLSPLPQGSGISYNALVVYVVLVTKEERKDRLFMRFHE